MDDSDRRGYTLVEVLVVVTILGVLAAVAYPQYQNFVWQQKDAGGGVRVKMAGQANRMYAADHGGQLVYGPITNACNSCVCGAPCASQGCQLVACKYLPKEDFDAMPFMIGVGAGCSNTPSCFTSAEQAA